MRSQQLCGDTDGDINKVKLNKYAQDQLNTSVQTDLYEEFDLNSVLEGGNKVNYE